MSNFKSKNRPVIYDLPSTDTSSGLTMVKWNKSLLPVLPIKIWDSRRTRRIPTAPSGRAKHLATETLSLSHFNWQEQSGKKGCSGVFPDIGQNREFPRIGKHGENFDRKLIRSWARKHRHRSRMFFVSWKIDLCLQRPLLPESCLVSPTFVCRSNSCDSRPCVIQKLYSDPAATTGLPQLNLLLASPDSSRTFSALSAFLPHGEREILNDQLESETCLGVWANRYDRVRIRAGAKFWPQLLKRLGFVIRCFFYSCKHSKNFIFLFQRNGCFSPGSQRWVATPARSVGWCRCSSSRRASSWWRSSWATWPTLWPWWRTRSTCCRTSLPSS